MQFTNQYPLGLFDLLGPLFHAPGTCTRASVSLEVFSFPYFSIHYWTETLMAPCTSEYQALPNFPSAARARAHQQKNERHSRSLTKRTPLFLALPKKPSNFPYSMNCSTEPHQNSIFSISLYCSTEPPKILHFVKCLETTKFFFM